MPFLRVAFIVLITCLPGVTLAQSDCRGDSADLRGDWGQARFTIELASDDASRAQGLMFRENLAASQGMLFVYDQPLAPIFWMKNTLIPLDMLFISETGLVQHVHHMAQPHDETPIRGGDGILMVLEIRGGMARVMGIVPGTQLRHPVINQEIAVWACSKAD